MVTAFGKVAALSLLQLDWENFDLVACLDRDLDQHVPEKMWWFWVNKLLVLVYKKPTAGPLIARLNFQTHATIFISNSKIT
jgi:hypothetical protein